MKHAKFGGISLFLVLVLILIGNIHAQTVVPTTLAILPFENNSITDPDKYAPLSKGLAAMLITDLKKTGTSLILIERNKIQAIIKEIAMGQTGSVDKSTAMKAGKILGAQSIAFGSFMVLGNDVRIDTRIVKVETSELIMSEGLSGSADNFIKLEQELARKIADSLKVALKPPTGKSKSDINAAIYFSQGLDALDRGDTAEAKRLFDKCIKLDSAYKEQVADAGGQD